ncbi:MAG: hypothetical protein FJZ87_14475 [Chloroflexi bacterium]|nr:hypothetical protein [Chloroflexota bacterium]
MAFYLGKRPQGDWLVFQSKVRPRRETHGHFFVSAIGPFKSKIAASWYHRYGRNNPQVKTPVDAERFSREDPLMELAIIEKGMTAEELADVRVFEAYERGVDELVEKREKSSVQIELSEGLEVSNL